MSDNKDLENNGKPSSSSTSNSGNDDVAAQLKAAQDALEEEKKAHVATKQQRNLYKNQADERETKISDLTKKNEELQGDFDTLRSEKEKSEKAQAINAKKAEILKDYPEDVRAKAEKLGVDLADPEDADAVSSFKERLDVLKGDSNASGTGDGTGTGDNKPTAPPISGDNPRPEGDKVVKTEAEIIAEEEDALADVKF